MSAGRYAYLSFVVMRPSTQRLAEKVENSTNREEGGVQDERWTTY